MVPFWLSIEGRNLCFFGRCKKVKVKVVFSNPFPYLHKDKEMHKRRSGRFSNPVGESLHLAKLWRFKWRVFLYHYGKVLFTNPAPRKEKDKEDIQGKEKGSKRRHYPSKNSTTVTTSSPERDYFRTINNHRVGGEGVKGQESDPICNPFAHHDVDSPNRSIKIINDTKIALFRSGINFQRG